MEILPISSYHEYCDPYVMEQYKTSTRLRALVDAMLSQCDDIESAFQEIKGMISPYDAVGPALDFIGELIGIIRVPGQTDDDYRQLILEGNYSEGLPAPEELRKFIQLVSGVKKVGLFPDWPAGFYYVLDGTTDADLSGLEENMTSGASLVRGTFLMGELVDGEVEFGYLVNEDTGTPLICDWLVYSELFDLVDDEGDGFITSGGDTLEALDYFST